jgi:hypothetical protein
MVIGRQNSSVTQDSKRTPSTRTRRILALSSGPVAILVAGLMVWQGSEAAFTAETFNAGNNWQAGSVTLSNDGTGGAMFSIGSLVPGQTGTHCIVVTATGVAGVVKTYTQDNVSDGLQNNITMKIEQGTGGTFADCTDFTPEATHATQPLATLFADHTSYATGILPWSTSAGTESKTYRFTWAFDTTGLTEAQVNALEGKSVRTTIEWELQNN